MKDEALFYTPVALALGFQWMHMRSHQVIC